MDLKTIKNTLDRLGELVDGWEKSGVDALERDLALAMLRGIYVELRFEDKHPEAAVEVVVTVEPEPVAEPKPQEEELPEPEPEVEVVVEPEPEPQPELVAEPEPVTESKIEYEEPQRPILPRRTVDPAVIRTLYGSEPITPKSQPEPETPKPQPESPKPHTETPKPTLGDVMSEGRQTLGEVLATGRTDMASHIAASEASSLRSSIGLNDKFLMIRDMFAGDEGAYAEAIATLDEFTDLDEAIIYIHDTYDWSADSDGVKLLVELLERKLS